VLGEVVRTKASFEISAFFQVDSRFGHGLGVGGNIFAGSLGRLYRLLAFSSDASGKQDMVAFGGVTRDNVGRKGRVSMTDWGLSLM